MHWLPILIATTSAAAAGSETTGGISKETFSKGMDLTLNGKGKGKERQAEARSCVTGVESQRLEHSDHFIPASLRIYSRQ